MAVEDLLSSYKGVLDAELVIAEDDIRIIRDKIAISLREDGTCKSMTDADKGARSGRKIREGVRGLSNPSKMRQYG